MEADMARWLGLVVALCASAFQASAANIGYSSSLYFGPLGQGIPMDLVISGVPGGVQVGAFDLTLMFNPTRLMNGPFLFGPSLGDPVQFEVLNNVTTLGPGAIEITSISLLSGAELQLLQTASFTLGTFMLTPTITGTSSVTVAGVVSDAGGNPISTSFVGATVTGVPEPASGLLLVLGLVILGCNRARWRNVR
jgi:hypothetical protein